MEKDRERARLAKQGGRNTWELLVVMIMCMCTRRTVQSVLHSDAVKTKIGEDTLDA